MEESFIHFLINAMKFTFTIRMLLRKSFSVKDTLFLRFLRVYFALISETEIVNAFLGKLVVFILKH